MPDVLTQTAYPQRSATPLPSSPPAAMTSTDVLWDAGNKLLGIRSVLLGILTGDVAQSFPEMSRAGIREMTARVSEEVLRVQELVNDLAHVIHGQVGGL